MALKAQKNAKSKRKKNRRLSQVQKNQPSSSAMGMDKVLGPIGQEKNEKNTLNKKASIATIIGVPLTIISIIIAIYFGLNEVSSSNNNFSIDETKSTNTHLPSNDSNYTHKQKLSINSLNKYIIKNLETKYQITSSNNTDLRIELLFSGKISSMENSLSYYSGGHLELLVNGLICKDFDSLIILRTNPFGDTRGAVDRVIKNQIDSLVNTYQKNITKQILECLR